MWVTIEVDPGDERLDTSGTTARRFKEHVDDMNDRPGTLEWQYVVEANCHTFDGVPVVEFDSYALEEYFASKLREDDYE